MSVRVQKRILKAAVQETLQRESELFQESMILQEKLEQNKKQLNQVWQGDVKLFKSAYNYMTKNKLETFAVEFQLGRYGQATIELILDHLVVLNDTSFNNNDKMVYTHNINIIEKYTKAGCPKYTAPPQSNCIAIGHY